MSHLEAVTRRMLALEAGVSEHPNPAVSVGTVIAELVGLEYSDELEHVIVTECQRARRLAGTHYAAAMGKPPDHPAVTTAVGFLQGITFARAAADVARRNGAMNVRLRGFTSATLAWLCELLKVDEREAVDNGISMERALRLLQTLKDRPDEAIPGGKWATIQHLEARIVAP